MKSLGLRIFVYASALLLALVAILLVAGSILADRWAATGAPKDRLPEFQKLVIAGSDILKYNWIVIVPGLLLTCGVLAGLIVAAQAVANAKKAAA